MIIQALPKNNFDWFVANKGLNDSNVEEEKDLHLISINYSDFPEWMPPEEHPHFKEDHRNVLRLFYDDVLVDSTVQIINKAHKGDGEWLAKAFTPDDANRVVDFLSGIVVTDDTRIVVHCKAGKSRSVATAHFACEFFGMATSMIYTNSEMKPNMRVLTLLRDAYNARSVDLAEQ
jgi:predicted protein tyrosine phosphatase